MTGGEDAAPAEREVEAEGETVGEAKWSALRELERRFPGVDKTSVHFQVVSEGERGLLGVGYSPARVIARVTTAPAPHPPGSSPALLRELLERITAVLGARVSVHVSEEEGGLVGSLSGSDLGLAIGKHGQTIDAIQYLANAVLARAGGERIEVTIDAAGYRDRRRATLEREADRAAAEATATGADVALAPMTAAERKIVHLRLKDRADVVTTSEGAEPNRHVVVRRAE